MTVDVNGTEQSRHVRKTRWGNFKPTIGFPYESGSAGSISFLSPLVLKEKLLGSVARAFLWA